MLVSVSPQDRVPAPAHAARHARASTSPRADAASTDAEQPMTRDAMRALRSALLAAAALAARARRRRARSSSPTRRATRSRSSTATRSRSPAPSRSATGRAASSSAPTASSSTSAPRDDDPIEIIDTETTQSRRHACRPGPTRSSWHLARRQARSTSPTRTTTWSPWSTSTAARCSTEIPVGVEPEGMGVSPDGKMAGQHLRDHQHGAFHRHRRPTRSSTTCWSTSGRASPSSPPTTPRSGSRPRSAARSA